MSLQRYGTSDAPTVVFQIDDLTYDYGNTSSPNQLTKVTDSPSGNNAEGFIDGNKTADDYTYDANGNLITDKNKNITEIRYNHLNLPTKITFGSTGTIEYIYNAAGQKLEKIVTQGTAVTSTNYLGGYQYIKPNLGSWALQYFPTAEGYVKNTVVSSVNTYSYVFNYTDHLGNIRLSYSDANKDGLIASSEILEENNYYPFGLKHQGYNIYPPTDYKYKYNGKELQDENIGGSQLNWYDYGARNYDPALGRWMNIDPLAETSIFFSPYAYALDNPVFFTDPDGMESVGADGLTNSQWIEASRPGADSNLAKQYQVQNNGDAYALELAKLCKHAYGDGNDIGDWVQVANTYSYNSGLKAQLFKKGSMYVLAIAGTEDFVDAGDDVTQVVGRSKQYKESLILVRDNLLKIKGIKGHLTVTGHSLGGGIADYISMNTGIHAVTFDAAGVSLLTSGLNRKSNTDAYILGTDPLNLAQKSINILTSAGGTVHYVTPAFNLRSIYNGHSIDNMIDALTPSIRSSSNAKYKVMGLILPILLKL